MTSEDNKGAVAARELRGTSAEPGESSLSLLKPRPRTSVSGRDTAEAMKQPLGRDPVTRKGGLPARQPGGFQTLWLNLYGWSVLVGAGLVLGAIAGLVTEVPLWITVPAGVIATWSGVLVLDERRFRNSRVRLGDERLDRESGAAIVARLEEMRIRATYDEFTFEADGDAYVERGILCRQADLERVRRVMSEQLT